MRRLHNHLLLTLVVGVVLSWGAVVLSGRLFETYAFFFDIEADTNNTITAGVLATPTLNSATAGPATAPGTITLSWTTPVGDPATHVAVFRAIGSCAGTFTPLATVAETPTTYADSGLAANTYCYKIRGVLQNWTSSFSGTKSATILSPVFLKLNSPNASINTLITGTASGNRTISGKPKPPFDFVVWSSAASVTVTASAPWTLTLDFITEKPTFESAILNVDLWRVANGACGTSPSGAGVTPIASGSATFVADGSMTLAPSALTPPVTGTLCLKITNATADSGAAHDARIVTVGGSTLAGPMAAP